MKYTPYEFKQEDVYRFARHIGAKTKEANGQLHFSKCPYCGNRTKDKGTFAISLSNGTFKCLRSSCGISGNMVKLSQDFDFSLGNEVDNYYKPQKQVKKFKKPDKPIEPKPPAIQFLASRGISEETAKRYEITTQTGKDNILVFPFYADNGDLMFIKYRKTDFDKEKDKNKEWCQANGTAILFGMNQCNMENKTLTICEGQLDSLSVSDCGIENALSVPTGAKGFTWVPNCWEFVNKFETIIVFGDHEKGHITLLDEIRQRFRKHRIKHVREEDYKDCKDANEILQKYGKEQVRKCIENAIDVPVRHVKEVADVQDINPYDIPKLKTGFKDLDILLHGGLPFGGLTLVTGKSGCGKSTITSEILLSAIENGHKCFAYSGELPNHMFKSWMMYQACSPSKIVTYDKMDGEKGFSVSTTNKDLISSWFRGKMLIFDDNDIDDDEIIDLAKIVEEVIIRNGVDVILIDNMMTAIDLVQGENYDKYEKQSQFVKKLARMAKNFNVLIVLVAHMRKNNFSQNGNDEVMGTSDITNLVSVNIEYGKSDKIDEKQRLLKCWKNRLFGEIKADGWVMNYEPKTKRVYGQRDDVNMKYSWEKHSETGYEQTDFIPLDGDNPFT